MGIKTKINIELKQRGFTIVEILIVIVVIGILAAIAIVAYTGISQKAVVASLSSDLENSAKQLKLDQVTNSAYPASTAAANGGQGLKSSSGTTYQYTVDNSVSPQTFCITATNGLIAYYITNDGAPTSGVCPGHIAPGVPMVSWVALTAGDSHNCGIYGSALYCWGRNNLGFAGQLGNGTTTNSSIPVAVTASGVLSGRTVSDVDAGASHTCAVVSDGDAFCWGTGANGRLGRNSTADSLVPAAVTMTGSLAGRDISIISAGSFHTCVIATGLPFCWGYNSNGQLGNGTTTQSLVATPVSVSGVLAGKTITQISAGDKHTCVLADGLPYCWGSNFFGQLGDGTTTTALSPIAVDTTGVLAGKTITQIVAGNSSSCVIADQSVYCWGSNANGGLGNTGPSQSYVPVAVTNSGVMLGTTATNISLTLYGGCAVATSQAFCWGNGTSGELGDGGTSNSYFPVQVNTSGVLSGMTVVKSVKGSGHSCVLASGSVYCWGGGLYGRLGNGSSSDSSVPVKVTNP